MYLLIDLQNVGFGMLMDFVGSCMSFASYCFGNFVMAFYVAVIF